MPRHDTLPPMPAYADYHYAYFAAARHAFLAMMRVIFFADAMRHFAAIDEYFIIFSMLSHR